MSTQFVAHRGGCVEFNPLFENQVPAYRYAHQCGMNAWETDVHLTKDQILMMHHDATIQARIVEDLTFAECQRLTDHHVNQLTELLAFLEHQITLFIDIKGPNIFIADKLLEETANYNSQQIVFICFDVDIVRRLCELKAKNRIYLLTNYADESATFRLRKPEDIAPVHKIIHELSLSGIGLEYHDNDEEIRYIVQELRRNKPELEFQLWSFLKFEGERLQRLALDLNINYCNTDYPKKTLQWLHNKEK